MCELTIASEIYNDKEFIKDSKSKTDGKKISKFTFKPFSNFDCIQTDAEGDLILNRSKVENYIELEYSPSTVLELVGQQIWRGAFLLADFLVHIRCDLQNKNILELGSGTGLTGIVAGLLCPRVVCTDVDVGDILNIIRSNIARNASQIKGKMIVSEIDFYNNKWIENLKEYLNDIHIVLAADVIYHNDLTDAFILTIEKLLKMPPTKTIYVALEKRFVFTLDDLDTVAPCYEHFLLRLTEMLALGPKTWSAVQMDIDFPQYFSYNRSKHLVLWKINS